MASPYSGSRVTVEVLVKEDQVTPVWVGLKLLEIPKHRPVTSLILKEYVRHTARQFSRYLHRVITFPDPVGNSTLKSSPR